ncbi:MAG TPA: serine hydroxymethyltransferase [Thermoprotei archaeon]|nr:serine hydroxymethyltransferase [Thermoprotei archaeon]
MIERMSPLEIRDRIFELIKSHHMFFSTALPLIASENIVSEAVKQAIISDFGHRYAEGWPGERVYAGCRYIDEVEGITISLFKKLFSAEFVDVRPISGVTANLAVYTAFTTCGDVMMCLSIAKGGHISMGKREFGGTAGAVHGLDIEYFEFDVNEMNIDVDATIRKVKKLEKDNRIPKLIYFGGSVLLFEHPVKELSEFFKTYDSIVGYDAAHVAGLIAGGEFQNPLKEGADVVSMSTHKTFFGPQRGAILSFNKHSEAIKKAVFPGVVSNHHLHTLAGLAIASTEMIAFGKEYAKEVVRTAKKLGESLSSRGFNVLGEAKGFTDSHQLLIDVFEYGLGGDIEKLLERAGIIVNRNLLPYDPQRGLSFKNPGGIRIGVQEIVRLGINHKYADIIADFFEKIIIKKEDPKKVREDVKSFRKEFKSIKYCFEDISEAYKYIELVK